MDKFVHCVVYHPLRELCAFGTWKDELKLALLMRGKIVVAGVSRGVSSAWRLSPAPFRVVLSPTLRDCSSTESKKILRFQDRRRPSVVRGSGTENDMQAGERNTLYVAMETRARAPPPRRHRRHPSPRSLF